jgi:hypothetical protein
MFAAEGTLVLHNASARHTWENVSFEYATWLRPMQGDGYVEMQSGACAVCPAGQQATLQPPYTVPGCGGGVNGERDTYAMTPGNVHVNSSSDIAFTGCTFRRLGAYAVAANGGSQRISWRHCGFSDTSSGALMLGGVDTCAEANQSRWDLGFHIANSTITNMPVEYTGATAVFFGYVGNSTLEHSLIANTSYSAMTIGWGWDHTACGRGNNHITANQITNSNTARCCDGGQVYTLGPQPGSTIARNHLSNYHGGHRAVGYSHDPNAVYHDNGSGGVSADQSPTLTICGGFCVCGCDSVSSHPSMPSRLTACFSARISLGANFAAVHRH